MNMDKTTAAFLLSSLLERIERDGAVGSVSRHEKTALTLAIGLLGPDDSTGSIQKSYTQNEGTVDDLALKRQALPDAKAEQVPPTKQVQQTPPASAEVDLNLSSIHDGSQSSNGWLLCLDFGTAMSKAFASAGGNKHLDLELGAAAGKVGFTLPSSVFVSDAGRVFFGFDAIEKSEGLLEGGRERLDSIKEWLSLRIEGDLDGDSCVLQATMNPTRYRMTQGDLIRIYLAYLTDMAEIAMTRRGVEQARQVQRRFARPCWTDPKQTEWVDREMRKMLADAQILADTFTGRWQEGLSVQEFVSALSQIKKLSSKPIHLIQDGVPEAVAVAAGAFAESENRRDAFMVVDVGAGTTDFGLFVSVKKSEDDEDVKVFQVPGSIQGMKQAGNTVDRLLRAFIQKKESIDTSDTTGKMIVSGLSSGIRGLKEALFKTGRLEYVLADGTAGSITLDEFLDDHNVKKFSEAVNAGFKKSLLDVDPSYLNWLGLDGVRLHVVLTGGGAQLPMMKSLAQGVVEVNGHRIVREAVNAMPYWMEDMPEELKAVYPQLAVAIGGAEEQMPETLNGPAIFGGGVRRPTYVI